MQLNHCAVEVGGGAADVGPVRHFSRAVHSNSKSLTGIQYVSLHLVHQGIRDYIIGKFILSYFFVSPQNCISSTMSDHFGSPKIC